MKIWVFVLMLLLSFSASAFQLGMGDNIRVLTVNGEQPVVHAGKIQLEPGLQTIQIQYGELFEDDVISPDDVRSKVLTLKFFAQGINYQLNAPENMNHDQALDFAANPDFSLNLSGNESEILGVSSNTVFARNPHNNRLKKSNQPNPYSEIVVHEQSGRLYFENPDPYQSSF